MFLARDLVVQYLTVRSFLGGPVVGYWLLSGVLFSVAGCWWVVLFFWLVGECFGCFFSVLFSSWLVFLVVCSSLVSCARFFLQLLVLTDGSAVSAFVFLCTMVPCL